MNYTELRTHSAFSFGDGTMTPESLIERAASLGYAALGLTDTADVGGVIRFTLAAEKAGIRPIAGVELKVDGHPMALLARDAEGYRNIAALVTKSRLGDVARWQDAPAVGSAPAHEHAAAPGFVPEVRRRRENDRGVNLERKYAVPLPERGRASLTFNDLIDHAGGVWCLTGPSTGELATLVRTERRSEALFQLELWRDVFGERLALEVQLHHVGGHEAALAAALIELAEKSRTKWCASNDPRYIDSAGRLVHDLLTANRADVCVHTAASWGLLLPNGEWRLKSPREMAQLWQGREAGLEATRDIALDCAPFDLRWLRPPMPHFRVPRGETDITWLRHLVYEGARERWGELDERQRAQIEHELGVIGRLDFAGFFIVMWDAIRFARSRDILCQGRGSAANSAVAYCLGITAVDPIRHGLLFERFLSEVRTDGRTEAPDIDVDFEMHRREEVLDYMYDSYGRAHSAITCVTQAYHAPTALQDMMRALGYPAEQAFALSKRMHHLEPSAAVEELKGGLAATHDLDLDTSKGRALLSALSVLDDVPRLRSTHPGGFVLSSALLGDYMPIEHTTMGRTILQFDKDDLDEAGVPKFDFLGLGGLSAIHLSFDAIAKRTGEKMEMYRLPVDDAKTYDMIARGDTVGTFQIESRAQIQSILQTKPERLYDIVVQVALIRPGPIQARFVHPYTERRRGRETVHYPDPVLEPILRRTYGVPIFQEQAMAISMALGGFTAGEADELRRAMGHRRKLPKLHAALRRLHDACVARGVAPEVADEVVQDLYSFANYGFPESHAWSFALIAYATAYLKANYPAEFFLGMLNAWPMGFYPPATLVHDARRHGVRVLGPCMRDGEWDCTIEAEGEGEGEGEQRKFNHRAHRAHREQTTDSFFEQQQQQQQVPGGESVEVEKNNPFSVCPVCSVVKIPSSECSACSSPSPALRIGWRHIRGLGNSAREALQAAHAQGSFTSIADVVRRAELSRADAIHLARAGAFEAFEPGRRRAAWEALRVAGDVLPLAPARTLVFEPRELDGEERIFLDYLATGICVDGHPMEHMRARLNELGVASSADLERHPPGSRIVVSGLVVARQHPATAKGTVFILLEDEFGYMNVIVPRPLYQENREVVRHAPFLAVEGRFERADMVMNIVGQRFRELKVGRSAREAGRRDKVNFRSRDFH
ncbi:MAG TPA: DNA polymerase III subunit alpha [Longimicrobiales bacterium]|nr:DNA polymerase III subunit alpha [Longimicrobiales bacterium]